MTLEVETLYTPGQHVFSAGGTRRGVVQSARPYNHAEKGQPTDLWSVEYGVVWDDCPEEVSAIWAVSLTAEKGDGKG